MQLNDKARSLLAWTIAGTIISTAAMLFRFWAAGLKRRKFTADDALCLISYGFTMACEGIGLWGIANGLGHTMTELTPGELNVQFKVTLYSSVTWLLGTIFIKLTVLQLYQRIFTTKTFKLYARLLMGITVAYGIAFLVIFITHCHPVDYMWNPVPGGGCRDITIEEICSVALNIVIDTFIIALPLPWLWKLKMPLRNKVFLTFMFTLGTLTLLVMCLRLWKTVNSPKDPIIALADIGTYSLIELWLGVLVSCMPTMAPLFLTYVKPAWSKISGRSSGSKQRLANSGSGGVKTIGGSGYTGGSSRPSRKISKEGAGSSSSEDSFDMASREEAGVLPLVSSPRSVHTKIAHSGTQTPPGPGQIHVQYQFDSRDHQSRVHDY